MQAWEAGSHEELKVCRVCLECNATASVFEWQDGVQLCTKMMKCAAVSVEPGDGLPAGICARCAAQLAAGYEFKERCEASERSLRARAAAGDVKQEVKLERDLASDRESDAGDPPPDTQDKLFHDEHQIQVKTELEQPSKPRVKTGPVSCPVCNKIFKCRSALEIHTRSHTKEKPYQCDVCKKTYSSKSILKIHTLRHYGKKPERKPLKETDGRRKRIRHGPFQCSACGRVLASRAALEAHARTHTGERPFACAACPASYRQRGGLQRHEAAAHAALGPDARFVCEHCGKTFAARAYIVTHLRVHSGERPYACARCPARFTQSASLARHRLRHTGEKPHACTVCGRAFRERAALRRHLAVHSAERAHACDACGKAFKTTQALREHTARAHSSAAAVCAECGLTLASRAGLAAHTARAHSARAGLCGTCHRHVPDLAAHAVQHSGARPHACSLCPRAYGTRRALAHHAAVAHRNKDKLRCTVGGCERGFPTAPMLEYHVLKAHTGAWPFACGRCPRAFRRRSDLTRHTRSHHHLAPEIPENTLGATSTKRSDSLVPQTQVL